VHGHRPLHVSLLTRMCVRVHIFELMCVLVCKRVCVCACVCVNILTKVDGTWHVALFVELLLRCTKEVGKARKDSKKGTIVACKNLRAPPSPPTSHWMWRYSPLKSHWVCCSSPFNPHWVWRYSPLKSHWVCCSSPFKPHWVCCSSPFKPHWVWRSSSLIHTGCGAPPP